MGFVDQVYQAIPWEGVFFVMAWAGLLALGMLPLGWAIHQRFFGGVRLAMGVYVEGSRRGRRPQRKQRILARLTNDKKAAERVKNWRALYIAAYILAVISPGIALIIYANFQEYFAPGAAPPFTHASSAPDGGQDGAVAWQIVLYFVSIGNFLALLAHNLADDVPAFAAFLMQFDTGSSLQPNPDALVYSGLVTAFKWVSGPAILLSGVVIADLRGGLREIRTTIERYNAAIIAIGQMPEGLDGSEYRQTISDIMDFEA
jgi:hypothetical protein